MPQVSGIVTSLTAGGVESNMDHKIIGGVLLVALAVAVVLIGVFIVGRGMVDNVTPHKRGRLLCLWLVLFALLSVPQYYLDNYMSGGRTRYWPMVARNWPVYTMFLSGWISSFIRTARRIKQ